MSINQTSLDALLQGLKASADPTRLRLLNLCAAGELTQAELTDILGQSQPRVARHLGILCDAGLLDRFRERQHVYYRLARRGPAGSLAGALLGQFPGADARLEPDRQRLAALKADLASQASELMRGVNSQWAATSTPEEEARIRGTILNMLTDCRIGALLDIGTGTGRMLRLLSGRAQEAVGVDLSSDMLAVARSSLEQAGLDHCMVRHGNMYQLPFSAGSFDTVTLDEVLGQAEDPARVIAEAARILRPAGNLLVVDMAVEGSPANGAAVSRYCSANGLTPFRNRSISLDHCVLGVLLARRQAASLSTAGQASGTNRN
ncbi:MAG: metalloregulator ArsR/SmtB family transcription factor [Gammaproteobacteria bacterium]|nr:metalloregulator ArsR/SmtB family transcription factor [Gammaproteobacteria bacterium]